MIFVKNVLFMQKRMGELFLHSSFAHELFYPIFKYPGIKHIIDIGPFVWILVKHLVHEAAKFV